MSEFAVFLFVAWYCLLVGMCACFVLWREPDAPGPFVITLSTEISVCPPSAVSTIYMYVPPAPYFVYEDSECANVSRLSKEEMMARFMAEMIACADDANECNFYDNPPLSCEELYWKEWNID